jgi:hypothetical protein
MIGFFSRETRFSIEPVIAISAWLALSLFLACGSLEAGAILFGSLLALMIDRGIGRTEPTNMSR